MRTVYKFVVPIGSDQEVSMPSGAKILHVDVQPIVHPQAYCIWVECETTKGYEKRTFRVVGTGHEISNDILRYLGTFMLGEGAFVGHVYEVLVVASSS